MDIGTIENLGIDRVLKRGSGEIILQSERTLLVRDSISGVHFLACEDPAEDMAALDGCIGRDCDLLVVTSRASAEAVSQRYDFAGKMACWQVAYYGKKPQPDDSLTVRTAEESDFAMLRENYQMISPEEMKRVIARGDILIGCHGDRPVGFIGEHLEGSMGMLYIFPEYRRRGFASVLQSSQIAKTMERGNIPFGQVETGNLASLALQEKLGMKRSEDLVVWLWK